MLVCPLLKSWRPPRSPRAVNRVFVATVLVRLVLLVCLTVETDKFFYKVLTFKIKKWFQTAVRFVLHGEIVMNFSE